MTDKADLLKRITIEPGKCGGRPCLRGTRMRVVDILELLSAGANHAEILADYPSVELDDILACLEYAARLPVTGGELRDGRTRCAWFTSHDSD